MNDHDLEDLIRNLKPAPLTEDIKARLSAEPVRFTTMKRRKNFSMGAIAAVLIAVIGIAVLLWPSHPTTPASGAIEAPVSVVKKDSTLLKSRTLAIKEYDGRLWEVSEQEWQDETLALCSVGPLKLSSVVIRREVVCNPVQFQ